MTVKKWMCLHGEGKQRTGTKLPLSMSLYRLPAEDVVQIKAVFSSLKILITGVVSVSEL